MPKHDTEFWSKARRARDKLVKQHIYHPDVTLISIGYPPEQDEVPETMVLRIHVKDRWMRAKPQDRISFPATVDEIPVVVIPEDQAILE